MENERDSRFFLFGLWTGVACGFGWALALYFVCRWLWGG